MDEETFETTVTTSDIELSPQYTPTAFDVSVVHRYLQHFVPTELAYIILDEAQYWACLSAERNEKLSIVASGYGETNNLAAYYLFSPAIPQKAEIKIQLVRFKIMSCDQGWGGNVHDQGTYNACYSWFEAGIVRAHGAVSALQEASEEPGRGAAVFNKVAFSGDPPREVMNPLDPGRKRWFLQFNAHASSHLRTHEVLWTKDDNDVQARARERGAGTGDGFVGRLTQGDRVAIIARAQYGGWANHVSNAKIEIFYSL
ncbi:hypothetical protein H0H81_005943 [Sphagnurus paluster]|uniref:Uncharacterized protein n=1 Tax=Sphagnurus paluster TaxID=117069 RepID=A0A9P7FYB4_9AGAR|nr:hypothetical protein H0H81_005943 [Sphagnurus paluster]